MLPAVEVQSLNHWTVREFPVIFHGSVIFHCIYVPHLFFFKFLAALGLRCCARAFSSCDKQGLLFVEVCGFLIVVASLVVEHEL